MTLASLPTLPVNPFRFAADPVSDAALTDTFEEAANLIMAAHSAPDLFGPWPADGDLSGPARTYRHLVNLVAPAQVSDSQAPAAEAVFGRLADFYAAFGHSQAELSGQPPAKLSSSRNTYQLGARIGSDELADLYRVTYGVHPQMSGLLKLVRDPNETEDLEHEAQALGQIYARGDPKHRAYVDALIDSFTYISLATGIERAVSVFEEPDGFVSLAQVLEAYPAGLDVRDAAWMWRRALVAIGYAHSAGVIHGAATPEHILIQPAGHGLMLTNWYDASLEPHKGPAGSAGRWTKIGPPGRWDKIRPPELANGQISPATDIYMATRSIECLLEAAAPVAIRAFIAGCTLERPEMRPQDAWELLAELDELLERLYGPRQFRPFVMPDIMGAPAAHKEA